MLDNTGRQCLMQTAIDYAFRHLDGWFINDIYEAVRAEPLRGLIAAQRIGNGKPDAPVYLEHNRWDSFAPYQSTRATASDWCTRGADVTLWTNEQPPFFNKLDVNSLLAPFVDGERSMAWITDRFNGVPTSSNCSELAA